MNTTHILTKAQAEAVYNAMCALNKVGAMIRASVPVDDATWVHIEECADTGQITLTRCLRRVACHSNQAAFAAAYGLDTGASSQELPRCRTEACVHENAVGDPCRSCKGSSNFQPWDDHGGEPQSAVAAAAGGLTQTAIER